MVQYAKESYHQKQKAALPKESGLIIEPYLAATTWSLIVAESSS